MQTALLLVDLQHDFLDRPGLIPLFQDIAGPIARILAHARATGIPVGHVRTRIEPSGRDRMPHWKRSDIRACVSGTPGEKTPGEFSELPGEPVFHKQFFSGFGNPELDAWLRKAGVEELWIAGVYTHGCVRSTVMDAYEKGYCVTVVDDGVADNDPLHGRVSRDWLNGRAARFTASNDLLGTGPPEDVHYNPVRPGQEVVRLRRSSTEDILEAIEHARIAGSEWCGQTFRARQKILQKFADRLRSAESPLINRMIQDLGKPRRDAADELRRACGHLESALQLTDRELAGRDVSVVYQPHGVVAIVTPWNNPVAIPVGKLAAALLFGNSVVWKPAFQADTISRNLLSMLNECGLPDGLVQRVNGGPAEVIKLAGHTAVAAVSLTGPERAGKTVSAVCGPAGKPLQAELGGNNAMLVLPDADLPAQVAVWARLAYGFAGQRCTAIRRFVVDKTVLQRFASMMVEAVQSLQLHHPEETSCDVGPLISAAQLVRVRQAVESALNRGGTGLTGGPDRSGTAGHYYSPALIAHLEPDDPLVQEELFGPVAVIQVAEGFEHGLALVNGVRHGLLAGIATASPALRDAFAARAEAGILIDGKGMQIHPAAPFGGRKASQIGPPEHGVWDRQFFGRVQARYGSLSE